MTTEHDTPEASEALPDVAVVARESGHRTDDTDPAAGAAHIDGETAVRDWEGLPPEAVVVVPEFTTPMRLPERTWAMLVLAVDVIVDTESDRVGEVELFAGSWMPEQPPADGPYDGDLVVRLTCPSPKGPTHEWHVEHADVELLLAYHGRWQRVGLWCGVDDRWPWLVAPTAAAVMGLHSDVTEAVAHRDAAPTKPMLRWARGGLSDLLDAAVVTAGEEVVWDRHHLGVRHTARIRADGILILDDGRVYANPSSATIALGGNHQNGWSAFRRTSDGRTLGDLRSELRARRGQ